MIRIFVILLGITSAFPAQSSTVSIMTRYVERDREEGNRRTQALFDKDRKYLCPSNTQKGMSLCVRDYISRYKIETAASYSSLINLIAAAALHDKSSKIYDSDSAQIISIESLVVLQEELKKENLLCATLKPSGPEHLLEIKKVCAEENQLLLEWQERTKTHAEKKLKELMEIAERGDVNNSLDGWKKEKIKALQEQLEKKFNKRFFEKYEYQLTKQDISDQHRTTIFYSCTRVPEVYKKRFNKNNKCQDVFGSLLMSCLEKVEDRDPLTVKSTEMKGIVQQPLPCYYKKVEEFLGKNP